MSCMNWFLRGSRGSVWFPVLCSCFVVLGWLYSLFVDRVNGDIFTFAMSSFKTSSCVIDGDVYPEKLYLT